MTNWFVYMYEPHPSIVPRLYINLTSSLNYADVCVSVSNGGVQ